MSNRSYGLLFSSPDNRDYRAEDYHEGPAKSALLPPLLDYRRLMPPVTNQGSEGACVGHAFAGFEGYRQNVAPAPGTNAPDREIISPRFSYWGARQLVPVQGDGAFLNAALKWAQRRGALTESRAPWVEGQRDFVPFQGWEADAQRNRIETYGRVALEFNSIARAILDFGPLFGEIMADDGFGQGKGDWGGALGGAHAVVICGYSVQTGRLLIRNSWGKDWGNGGYQWYPFGPQFHALWFAVANRSSWPAWVPYHERWAPSWFLEA